MDIAREDIKLPETMTTEGFEYNEATYHNVIRQYEWLVFLFPFFCGTSFNSHHNINIWLKECRGDGYSELQHQEPAHPDARRVAGIYCLFSMYEEITTLTQVHFL